MPLTSEQESKIKNHLSKYLQFNKCPVCEGNRWTIENELAAYQMFDTQYKMMIEGQIYPMAIVSCEKCHYSLSFNAIKLGLL
jgi:predicted nucleic-acid-binding Zn-ribbon protein